METKLSKIAHIAKVRPEERFTSLAHLLNEDMLLACHRELSNQKAPGIDEMTKAEYEVGVVERIKVLHESLKKMRYRPQAVKRVYIPKAGSREKRALGIPAYEDKIVQLAVSKILVAIYEQDFLNHSYGFRPGRGCHDALCKLDHVIMRKKTNWVVDADIAGFFDHVDHGWMMKCLEVRIVDRSLLRIIGRMLKAGIMDKGVYRPSEEGTPQGGIISPVLANIYLHYVLDLWFEKVVTKQCKGSAHIVRYADDFVCCFQYEKDAKRFYQALNERLAKCHLSLSTDKSKVIAFGPFAKAISRKRGRNKPETFDFLGFTHYCGVSRKGKFRVKRKTSRKKLKASLYRMKQWFKVNRHMPVGMLLDSLKMRMSGHYRYYGINDNYRMLSRYFREVLKLLFKWLNRRSQRNSYTWKKLLMLLRRKPLPKPRIYVNLFNG